MRHHPTPPCAVAIAILIGLTACTTNPVTGERQLDLMGESQEIQLGEQLYPRYTQISLGEVPQGEVQSYVNSVGQHLSEVSHRPVLPYHFNAVNDPVVNAYALPGGKISITRGLLARFGTEDEMAAVLGHETGHVTARHASAQYTRSMLAQLALLGAEVYMQTQDTEHRDLYRVGAMVGAQLALAHYSREQERQADDVGMQYMVDAGYNPEGMVRVMEVLASASRRQPNLLERMFSSHPLTEERIATASAHLAEMPPEVRQRPLQRDTYLRITERVRAQRDAYDRLAEARTALADNQPRRALSMMQQSVDEWPSDGILRTHLAAALLEQERVGQAMRHISRAERDAPEVFLPHFVAGQTFLVAERYREALSSLDQAGNLLPEVAEVIFLKGVAYQEMGQGRRAAEQYNQVIQIAPNSELATRAAQRMQQLGYQPG